MEINDVQRRILLASDKHMTVSKEVYLLCPEEYRFLLKNKLITVEYITDSFGQTAKLSLTSKGRNELLADTMERISQCRFQNINNRDLVHLPK